MKSFIDKDALVAEIEGKNRKISPNADWYFDEYTTGYVDALKDILSFIDTLEVKEVDLEKEVDDYVNEYFSECDDGVLISDANSMELTLLDITPLAKHFFELGLKTKNNNESIPRR